MDGTSGALRSRPVFGLTTLFFTIAPLLDILSHPPATPALLLLLAGWGVFGLTLIGLFRRRPGGLPDERGLAVASLVLTVLGAATVAGWGATQGAALFFYAGVTGARVRPERVGIACILLAGAATLAALTIVNGGGPDGLGLAVTVVTVSLLLHAMIQLRRTNRALEQARHELAALAVVEERQRIARDLHDSIGHSLAVIALKSELARRVLPGDPARAATEIGQVEQVAREALVAVRETVEGYRRPTLAAELTEARSALAAAGIESEVDGAPPGLSPDADAVLAWAVREGVTNVLRHSGATRAWIHTVVTAASVAVEIGDDGRGPEPRHDGGGGELDRPDRPHRQGSGLAGLRERALPLGGRVEAGPLATGSPAVAPGGFRLSVTLPASGTSPADA
ncbi:MAG: sensor histidine kinase [Chloroflexota bacterium]